ncbi:MAG: hypothetical protein WAM46_05785 [Flavobacterium sp.]
MKIIFTITLLVLMFICCKDIDRPKEIVKTEINNTETFKEVVFTKNYKSNSDVNELNITYKNYILKFRFIEDITILQFVVDNKIVSDWKQVLFNFQYLPENYDGIRLLSNKNDSEAILLLPGYTEEYPNLISYEFDKSHFSYSGNLDIKSSDLNKIPLDRLIKEWNNGSFEAIKKENEYILTFTDDSKKNILNFENSQSNDLLSAAELKNYINKISALDNKNSEENSTIDEFQKDIKKQGFKIVFEKNCDLNQDKIQDKISVYSTDFPEKNGPNDYKEFIVYVHISGKSFKNKNIISKYYADNVAIGFSDVKVKDNYFTIEQVNGLGNGMVQEYTTFKFLKETNEIILHKYSRIENERSNGDEKEKSYSYTNKNFGTIPFEDYNSETILEKCRR